MHKQLINGHWVDAVSKGVWEVINPALEEVVKEVPYGDDKDFKLALKAADLAFDQWSRETPYFRADFLKKTAEYIRINVKQFGTDTILETGKPRNEAEGEWLVAANLFEWFAEEGKRNYGRVIPSTRKDKRSQVIYQAMGVVGVITAWNFPAYNPARAVAAALAAGCTVVLKGSEFTPLTSFNLASAMKASGIPDGVVNVINGDAVRIGEAMLDSPELKKISFTGSTRVGKILMDGASKTHTKLSLELGGNAPVIIDKDINVAEMAKMAVIAKLRNCGQVCVAPQRYYVHKEIIDNFLEEATKTMKEIKTGINTGDELCLGPLINKKQQVHVKGIIEAAQNQGAKIISGGTVSEKGFFIEPTLIKATQAQDFIKEEIFGPVLPVISFSSKEEVVQWANETSYGLAAYIFTNNLNRAYFFAENIRFGIVGINEWAPHGTELPFSGWNQSGLGHESGAEGLKEYLELKLISIGGIDA
ncbi:aldehyde dehydrogenase family protein [Namhaeicola litoreus]|uniref:Aldehyde dehydrogenase family protein n=1 Tax=Namhaeicola litoreus TaxID=1052145 RepID=A0ABW3Y1C0_9FLAO